MWPIPSLQHEFVTISFSPSYIACSWIQKTKNGSAPLILRAYQRHAIHDLELFNLIPFNPTCINKHIRSFLDCHDLHNAFIIFCLQGPSLQEQFVMLPTSTPHRTDFSMPN